MRNSLISRAMRELAKRRHAKEDPERLKEITSRAGRASWKKMTEQERQARIAKMVAARRKRVAETAIAESGQTPSSRQGQKRKLKNR